jgi:hypothetical protein
VCWRQSSLQQANQQQQQGKGGQAQMQLRHGTPTELGEDGCPTALVLHPKSIAPNATTIVSAHCSGIGSEKGGGKGSERRREKRRTKVEEEHVKAGGWQWLVYEEKVNTGGRATWASGVTSTPPLSLLLLTFLPPIVLGLASDASYATADGESVDASVCMTSTACSALNICCSKRTAALLMCLHSAVQHRLVRSAEKGRGWQLHQGLLGVLSQILRARLAPVVPRN